jgi:hypothetical protein
MTTSKSDDRNVLRDPRVDAAWRAASRAEPPAALDAAILAAARREVGAGPQSTRKQEAMRTRRWWWPLAVAATLGAITVGLLQTVTPDRLGAPALDNTVVTDMPTPVAKSASKTATPMPAAKPSPETMTRTPLQQATTPGSGNEAGEGRVAPRANAAQRTAIADRASQQTATADRAAPRTDAPRSPATVASALAEKKMESASRDGSALPEPFSGAPPQPGPAVRGDATPTAAPAIAGGTASSSAPTEPSPSKTATAAPTSERAPAARDAVTSTQSAAAPVRAPPPPAFAAAQRLQENPAARSSPVAKMAAGSAAVDGADEPRVKDRAPLPVAEWIALIRRLRAEGNTADATKELAAFRVAHIDHEKLLPPDLRDWRPPEK